METKLLGTEFYSRPATLVARELLGAQLVRILPDGYRLSGRIVETEAYTGLDDMASHGRHKRTPRNLPMWKAPGIAYIYLTRGIHWMFNVVAEPVDKPAAVLIRAIEPLEGLAMIAGNRSHMDRLLWTSGPARLTAALLITGAMNEANVTTTTAGLWIEADQPIPDTLVRSGPRVGLGKTPEPWLSIPWRWWVGGNPYVSNGSGKRG